ncbi:MAG: hypothetical protein V4772_03445 [Pseudomonadota bacterium]
MWRVLALVLLTGFHVMAAAQVCAPPALLLTTIPPGGIINDFYAGSGTPNLNAGVTSFTLGTRDTRGYTTTLVIGDLLMVMQMQDGTIDSSDNSNYGDGSGVGSGSTSVGNAGLYEFVRITAVAGLNVTVTPPLTNSYRDVDATATTSQRRYQVVRVLQFSSVTAANVSTPAWNGVTGGAVAMDVRDTLTLGSSTIEGQANRAIFVAGKGFRGARGVALNVDGGATIVDDYASASTLGYHGGKGEGFIGTPRYIVAKTNGFLVRATVPTFVTTTGVQEGYPGGSFARGAPGNAGGGGVDSDNYTSGNANNAGGGGGGNYGPGGIGGRPWASPLLDLGGRGGAGYASTLAFNRIFMGGGGGAGGSNDATSDAAVYTNNGTSCNLALGLCSSGAAGGGVVVIRARQITGTGIIDARGAHAYNVNNDAGGGGGAGGSVILETPNGGSAIVDVSGGDGGNARNNNGTGSWPGERHGPGGAGGGGFVAYAPNTMAVSVTYNGGAPGETTFDGTAAGKPVPEYYGSAGFNGGITTFLSPNVPGAPQAALCDPNLSLTKSNGVTALASPGSTTYTFTITNSGNSASNGTITLADRLPPGLTVTPGALATGGPNGASFSCTAANTTDIICTSTVIVQPSGGTRVFTIGTTVNGTNGLSIVNRAVVSGGGDPNKATTATVVIADTCTANNTPAGCAIDTDTILAPNLSLAKTDGTTTVARGGTVVYNLTVTNGGGSTTVGSIVVADMLPTGLTFSGTSPFTINNFTCTVSGQGITCTRATALAASTSALITFTAVVGNSAPSSVVNLAKVGGGGDPSPSKSTAPTTVTAALCPSPTAPADTYSDPDTGCASDADAVLYVDIELTKDDGQLFVNSGGTTDYVYVLRNIGTAPTTGQINFGDVVQGNTMTFVATGTFTPTGTDGADWSCTNTVTSTTFCVSSVSIPAGGSSSFILRVNVGAATVGVQQTNRARIGGGGDVSVGSINSPTAANITACVGNGNPVGCATDLNTVQASAEIRMSKTHPDPQIRSVGDTFAFTLTIRNNSGTNSGAANTIRMIDVVPPNLTIGTVTANAPFTCATAAQVITCNNTGGALNAGLSRTITVAVTVAAAATNQLINKAKVSTNGADPQNNVFPTTTTVALCSGTDTPAFGCAVDPVTLNADLQIYKDQRLGQSGAFQTGLLGVALGDVVQYRLRIVNATGSAVVSTATFSDPVPFHVSVNGASTVTLAGGATGCSVAYTGSQLNGTVTSLPAGATCTVVIEGTATTSSAGATNTALVTVPAGINDTVPGNNTSTVLTAIGVANLSVTKTDGVTTIGAGANTTYTIVATNAGPSPANGARIYDPVATGLSCTAAPSCVASGAAVCPAGLTMGQLQNAIAPLGVANPTFGSGGSITITVVCGVTASGQ